MTDQEALKKAFRQAQKDRQEAAERYLDMLVVDLFLSGFNTTETR